LSKIKIIEDQANCIDDAIAVLKDLNEKKIGFEIPEKNNIAKKIARTLHGKFPVIYAAKTI